MARPPRLQFPNAIYHITARGNDRQDIFLDDDDRLYMLERLETTVHKFGWRILTFVLMTNHLHKLLQTPEPNLSEGMQFLLSGYASRFNARHGRCGDLFQGRFGAELIEDESYYWNVSKYIQLNPIRTSVPMVERLEDFRWSSYPGFRDSSKRLSWVDYERVLAAWTGATGTSDAATAYREFVEHGMEHPPRDPFLDAIDGWILGSQAFVEKLRSLVDLSVSPADVPKLRRFHVVELHELLDYVTGHFQVPREAVCERNSRHLARCAFAWLARRHTQATRRTLATFLELTHPDSVSNLLKKMDRERSKSRPAQFDLDQIQSLCAVTVNGEAAAAKLPKKKSLSAHGCVNLPTNWI